MLYITNPYFKFFFVLAALLGIHEHTHTHTTPTQIQNYSERLGRERDSKAFLPLQCFTQKYSQHTLDVSTSHYSQKFLLCSQLCSPLGKLHRTWQNICSQSVSPFNNVGYVTTQERERERGALFKAYLQLCKFLQIFFVLFLYQIFLYRFPFGSMFSFHHFCITSWLHL